MVDQHAEAHAVHAPGPCGTHHVGEVAVDAWFAVPVEAGVGIRQAQRVVGAGRIGRSNSAPHGREVVEAREIGTGYRRTRPLAPVEHEANRFIAPHSFSHDALQQREVRWLLALERPRVEALQHLGRRRPEREVRQRAGTPAIHGTIHHAMKPLQDTLKYGRARPFAVNISLIAVNIS